MHIVVADSQLLGNLSINNLYPYVAILSPILKHRSVIWFVDHIELRFLEHMGLEEYDDHWYELIR